MMVFVEMKRRRKTPVRRGIGCTYWRCGCGDSEEW
jgi:hypothetical protein